MDDEIPAGGRTRNTRVAHILDFGPKAAGAKCANILHVNPPLANSIAHHPRRFVLLPEQGEDVSSRGPRIRRYRLASVGRRSGTSEDAMMARMARELGHLGRG